MSDFNDFKSEFYASSDDLDEHIFEWEDRLDAAGPFADLSTLRNLLNEAPEGAPSFSILKDMIAIRSRVEGN